MEIVLATSNKGKIQELQSLLRPLVCHSQEEFGIASPAETGLTFIENALIKARYTSQLSNRPALADDSGLVVPLLQGEPGIYSARYAGEKATDEENINKLLQILKLTGQQQVEAYFYCAVSFLQHANDPTPLISCGKITGKIVMEPRGSNGFGYDPIFYLPEQGCTAAELRPSLKNEISHRAKAIKSLCSQLKELF